MLGPVLSGFFAGMASWPWIWYLNLLSSPCVSIYTIHKTEKHRRYGMKQNHPSNTLKSQSDRQTATQIGLAPLKLESGWAFQEHTSIAGAGSYAGEIGV
jgi:MFS family permease